MRQALEQHSRAHHWTRIRYAVDGEARVVEGRVVRVDSEAAHVDGFDGAERVPLGDITKVEQRRAKADPRRLRAGRR
jgi:hypothetical protein